MTVVATTVNVTRKVTPTTRGQMVLLVVPFLVVRSIRPSIGRYSNRLRFLTNGSELLLLQVSD